MIEVDVNMLTNPVDYINYYVDILKKEYKLNDLKVNYHGLIGFLMNLFGWTNYDIKQYYDYLFKEGFLATAEESKNLYLHASTYGYVLNFAIPATVSGNFVFDFANLSKKSSNIYKREIIFPTPLKVKIGNFDFQTDSQYTFVEEGVSGNFQYYCKITNVNDRMRLVSSASPKITVPIYNLKQYTITEYDKAIPNYEYGIYYQYNIALDSTKYLSDIIVNIKKVGSSSYEEYTLSRIKSFDTSLTKSVYLDQKSDTLCVIETGNGYHGEWIPNASMNVKVYTTRGSIANSLAIQTGSSSGLLNIINYNSSLDIISQNTQSISATNFLVNSHSVIGGTDVLSDSDLKNDIVKWVETRKNLINRADFFNVYSAVSKDFDIVFKKNQFIDNNFYLCRTLRDQYKNIFYTTNYTYKCNKYDDPNLIVHLTATVLDSYTGSTIPVGRQYYKIVAVDKFYEALPSSSVNETILTVGQAISLTWDVVPQAEYYKVYGRTNSYASYWVVDKDHLDIDGQVYFIDDNVSSTAIVGNCGIRYLPIEQIDFPEFEIDLSETIDLSDDVYSWHLYSSTPTSITYYIDNKTFWFTPEIITRENSITNVSVTLTKVLTARLDQLVNNSWVIINERLYFRLTEPFDESTDIVKVKFNKDVTLISPFVYKYNSFFDWFEGYFIYDNIVQYPIVSDVLTGINPPISHVNIVYDSTNYQTNVYLKSYQTIDPEYTFRIKIDNYNIDYDDVEYDEDTKLFYYQIDGFITGDIKINISCYLESVLQFKVVTVTFQQTYKISDQLLLVKYISEDNDYYICNIPLLSFNRPTALDTEFENRDYVYSQIFDFVANSDIDINRIQSDSVQTRFLNTTFCTSYFSSKLLVQGYDQNIILPLNISIAIRYKNSNINFSDHYSDIELLVAEYLQTYATGIDIKFYNSQIIDLIHNYSSDIISVSVNVYDSYGTLLNSGIQVKDKDSLLPAIDDKLKLVEFTSVYFWWNLNNISITQTV